jgi:hypothetical protein
LQAKDYVAVSPEGKHIHFSNSLTFIKDNPHLKINQANLSACARGVRRHCWGWRFFFREDYEALNGIIPPLEYAELGKKYVAISPSGEHIEFVNARQFCRDYPEWKFNPKNISSCTKGKKKTHKGWQFFSQEGYLAWKTAPPAPVKIKYVAITPSGEIVPFSTIAAFVKDNPDCKFHATLISRCLGGLCETYKKWRFYYAEDYYQSAA